MPELVAVIEIQVVGCEGKCNIKQIKRMIKTGQASSNRGLHTNDLNFHAPLLLQISKSVI